MGISKSTAFLFAAVLFVPTAGLAETVALPFDESKFPLPDGKPLDGPLPREALFLICVERDATFEEKDAKTRFCIFDTGKPDEGFRDVFSAPTEHQFMRFVTPLFGGWGIAAGSVNRNGKPEGREAFWFNPLTATRGATILEDPGEEWTGGTELRLMRRGLLHRFDLASGILRKARFELDNFLLLDRNRILATSNSIESYDAAEHKVLRLSLDRSEAEVLAKDLPSGLGRADWGRFFLGPAGEGGAYYVHGFSLYWHPKGGPWHKVVGDVHIVKTFGGTEPWLPVCFVGEGRFAVAKTVKDSVGDEGKYPPKGLCVTMLIDGKTGKVLEETEPETYDHNPECNIPDGWWSKDIVARREKEEKEAGERKSFFRYDEATNSVSYGDGKRIVLPKEGEARLSQGGRYLVVYEKWSRNVELPSKLVFTLVDGKDGTQKTIEVASAKAELFVQALAWLPLHPPEVSPEAMDGFHGSRWHPFYDPWKW